MKKVNISTKEIGRFAGKWVAIDPQKDMVIAVGETLHDIAPLVTAKEKDKKKIKATSFKVPYKDEGPYVLPFLRENDSFSIS